jgi:hypothetical protein
MASRPTGLDLVEHTRQRAAGYIVDDPYQRISRVPTSEAIGSEVSKHTSSASATARLNRSA